MAPVKTSRAFTLIELLVVIAIIAHSGGVADAGIERGQAEILAAQLRFKSAPDRPWHEVHADDNNGLYPESGGAIAWNQTDAGTHSSSWMQQIDLFVGNTNVYHCPGNAQLPAANQSPFNYFNGVRAAFIVAGGFAPVIGNRIRFPSAFVLSGDTIDNDRYFEPADADKDDYSQNCVGSAANPEDKNVEWQAHSKGQNILFDDSHVRWYKGYNTNEMTFRYDSMHWWSQ